jgi:hypothetical protein
VGTCRPQHARAPHLRGPTRSLDGDQPYVTAIEITADPDLQQGRRIYIGENEFLEWPGNAVAVQSTREARTPEQYLTEWARLTRDDAPLIRIERNFIHHNSYGVSVGSGAVATVLGNVFDFNWHAVSSDGYANSGYIARFNYVLEGGFTAGGADQQHFDVHGTNDTCILILTSEWPPSGTPCLADRPPPPPRDNKVFVYRRDNKSTGYGGSAGDYYEVKFNTIRGAQAYYCFILCFKTRSALALRGKQRRACALTRTFWFTAIMTAPSRSKWLRAIRACGRTTANSLQRYWQSV